MAKLLCESNIHSTLCQIFNRCFNAICPRRCFSTNLEKNIDRSYESIRNVGIIAHIDAGKTTLSERILFYSGFSKFLGEVHDGDTVMDFMAQERERGITINSAAITFKWNGYKVNLIDTPGHVDFTVEVERSLRVLDGAVTIIDASAGVEAQTLTVWNQAERYKIPRIIFCNKMDKPRANFYESLESIEKKLKAHVLPLQLPIKVNNTFCGIVDLIAMKKIIWKDSVKNKGTEIYDEFLTEQTEPHLWLEAAKNREDLIENLGDLDDTFAEIILSTDSIESITNTDIFQAVRRVTLNKMAFPVFCGSAYKNIGVQAVMDAMVNYLPNPEEVKHDFVSAYQGELCSMAFKNFNHKLKGPLTFVRIYSNNLTPGNKVYNASRNTSERINKIYSVYADDYREVSKASSGEIVAVSGLKNVITGDTLASSHASALKAKKTINKLIPMSSAEDTDMLTVLEIPEPVFFCTIEPASLSHQKPLEHALECLQKEDPSFHVNNEHESGEIVISGMGELHIDIIKDRIKREYKVDCELSDLNVAYKETINGKKLSTHILDRVLGETKHHVEITLSIDSCPGLGVHKKVNLHHSKESNLNEIRHDRLQAIENGIKMALMSGPLRSYPVIDVNVGLHMFSTTYSTSLPMISACASQCVNKMLKESGGKLLEPIMKLEIRTDEKKLGAVLADLSARHGSIINIASLDDTRFVTSNVPLSKVMGYATQLRILTSGLASFSMQFDKYEFVS